MTSELDTDGRGLVERIVAFRRDPVRRTTMARMGQIPPLYPPVSADVVRDAESRLGFALPWFLAILYLNVGNGGFGPGYGIWGLAGGMPASPPLGLSGQDLVSSYLDSAEVLRNSGFEPEGRQVMICDWGCGIGSGVDCSLPDGEMIFLRDDGSDVREGLSFRDWMSDWADGIDIWQRASDR